MSGGGGKIQETDAQKAQADVALKYYDRYQSVEKPAQQFAIDRVQKGFDANKATALGTASSDVAGSFAGAGDKVAGQLQDAGAGMNSGKSMAATTDQLGNQAASRGLALSNTDQAVEDTHRTQQQGLMALGRGQAADSSSGFGALATLSGRQAANDAAISGNNAAATGEFLGTVGGVALGGLRGYLNKPATDNYSQQKVAPGSY